MELVAEKLEELEAIATQWITENPSPTICLLNGDMGTGKTTFVKALCNALHVPETISSPTFSLVNEYVSENGITVYHFDLYRLKEEEELYDFGFEEYLNRNAYVFIEWPAIGNAFYPEDVRRVNISVKDGRRVFNFN